MLPSSLHALPHWSLSQKPGCHHILFQQPSNQSKASGFQISLESSALAQVHTASCLVYCHSFLTGLSLFNLTTLPHTAAQRIFLEQKWLLYPLVSLSFLVHHLNDDPSSLRSSPLYALLLPQTATSSPRCHFTSLHLCTLASLSAAPLWSIC